MGVSIRLRTKELRLVIDRDRKIVEPAVTIGKLNKVLLRQWYLSIEQD